MTLARVARAWHLLSLDAPTVAVTWCLAFARTSRVPALPATAVFLGLVTWICYVGDRVLDARPSRDPSRLRPRHRFYGALWRERRGALLFAVGGAATVCSALAVTAIPRPLLLAYVTLTLVSLTYFAAVHARGERRGLAKEAAVGVLFAAGCVLPSAIAAAPRGPVLAAGALFAGLGWLDCVASARWEGGGDVDAMAHPSTRWASRHVSALLVAGAACSAAAGWIQRDDRPASHLALCLGAAFALLLVVERGRRRLSGDALRVLADAVLLTPLPWMWHGSAP